MLTCFGTVLELFWSFGGTIGELCLEPLGKSFVFVLERFGNFSFSQLFRQVFGTRLELINTHTKVIGSFLMALSVPKYIPLYFL